MKGSWHRKLASSPVKPSCPQHTSGCMKTVCWEWSLDHFNGQLCWHAAGKGLDGHASSGQGGLEHFASTGVSAHCPGTLPGTQSVQVSSPKSPPCILLPLLKSTAEGGLLHRNQIILLMIFTGVFLTQIYDNETLWN